MRVLAVDPGEKVGWARATIRESHPRLEVEGHGISHLKEFGLALHNRQTWSADAYDVIVLERYRIAAGKAKEHIGSDVPTLQCVGMVRLCGWLADTPVVIQPARVMRAPSQAAMPAWLEERIAGLPAAHDERHDESALRHLWHYYFQHHFDPTQDPA